MVVIFDRIARMHRDAARYDWNSLRKVLNIYIKDGAIAVIYIRLTNERAIDAHACLSPENA